jgi:lysophospholipase L1-like esterase
VKRRVWSFILCLELLLAGAWFLRSIILDNLEGNWQTKQTLTLAVGGVFFVLGVYICIKQIKNAVILKKMESISRYFVQASLWCLLVFLTVELTLRVTLYNPPLRRDVTNWAGDLPGAHTFILWGKEGYGLTRYDRWGAIQTPYHDNKKDNNVIVLGDSQTECLQVSDNLKFVSVAETLLRRDGYNADLHNLGRSGLAVADYVSWIPPFRSIFRPKAIVVQLTHNDFFESFEEGQFNRFILEDNSLDLFHVYDLSGGFVQKARKKYRIGIEIEELGRQRWLLMRASFAESGGMSVMDEPFSRTANGNSNAVFDETPLSQTMNLQESPVEIPAEQIADTSVFDPLLADLQIELLLEASEGVPLVVVLLPSAPYISGDGIEMDDPRHQQLVEFMKRYPEVTVVDPLPAFQELAFNGRLPRGFFNSVPGTGHLNGDGNRIVGQLLAQAIGQVLK